MIKIYGFDKQIRPRRKAISDAIHACMVDVLSMPEGTRAHRFIRLQDADFFVPEGRSKKYIVVEICLMEGRSVETRKALIKALFRRFELDLGIVPLDVEITIFERPGHDWGFRGMTGDEAALNYPTDL